jgi:ribosomal protein S27E
MNFLYRLNQFMAGRYGMDQLSIALTVVYFILAFFANFARIPLLLFLGAALICWVFFRMLSRNIGRRQMENEYFMRFWRSFSGWFRNVSARFHRWQNAVTARAADRQTHRYFKCPHCKNTLRVPKGKGKIAIHCPVCGTEFIKKA